MKLRTLILVSMFLVVWMPVSVFGSTWAKSYGDSDPKKNDRAYSIQVTSDNGSIVAGIADPSVDSDINKKDVWVLKLDSDGSMIWQKIYNRSFWDIAESIQQTTDGGYIVAGHTEGIGSSRLDVDYWILKLDENGNVTWQKTYGDTRRDEYAQSIHQTTDGGYIVAGTSDDLYDNGEFPDYWILKLDADGNVIWQKTYGRSGYDCAGSIQQTTDGGYIVLGWSSPFDEDEFKCWVLKLDADGNVIWQKIYGRSISDHARSIQQTTDGGYILAGYTSNGSNGWVLKLDAMGDIAWQKAYGGSKRYSIQDIQETTDGGYIVASDATEGLVVFKLDAIGNVVWQKTYADNVIGYGISIQGTSDNGFMIAGSTYPYAPGNSEDAWVMKLDANGNIPGCNLIGNASITPINTAATPVVTTATVADTHISPRSTSAIPQSKNISVESKCFSTGTCGEGHCGGKSADECWCDELCTTYGDCCNDYNQLCGTCGGGRCGGKGAAGCWCDDHCKSYGDCCPDYDQLCVIPPPPECETMADCPKGDCVPGPGIGRYECRNGKCVCMKD